MNGLDPDGRCISEAKTDFGALTSSYFWGGMGSDLVNTGVRFGTGIKQAGLVGSDMIGFGASSAFGYGDQYQGSSQLFQNLAAAPQNYSVSGLRHDILVGGVKAELNTVSFGAVGYFQGMATGNYTQAQDSAFGLLLGAGALRTSGAVSTGFNNWVSNSLDASLPNSWGGASILRDLKPGALNNIGPVVVNPPPNASLAQIQQVQSYVNGANQALEAGLLENGRVSTAGILRSDASSSAAAERARAAAAGVPYQGQVGHVPDTTWMGAAEPYMWLDLDKRVNLSIGGQANRYPLGYVPTQFVLGGVK